MNKIKSVVVLGARSGTSLVAGMLHILGVDMGDEMRAPDATNPTGYYEDLHFVKVTSDLIEASKSGVFETKNARNTTLGHLMNIRDVVWKHEGPLWGFKAPGTIFVLPLYELFLRNPHYIVCRRDPVQVGKSLKKMGHKLPKSKKSWTEVGKGVQNALMKNTAGKKRFIVDFDVLMSSPEKIVDGLIEFLELKPDKKVREGAINLADPGYRHEK